MANLLIKECLSKRASAYPFIRRAGKQAGRQARKEGLKMPTNLTEALKIVF